MAAELSFPAGSLPVELLYDPLDELRHRRAGRPLVARVVAYPRLPVLFRTEEVVYLSAAAVEGVRRLWCGRCDLGVFYRYRYSVQAMSARVLDVDPFFGIVAADQQHEVYRSGYVEHLAAGPHGVEVQAYTFEEAAMIVRWTPPLRR